MKYMGHKGRILDSVRKEIAKFIPDAHALCDAFCGSAIVAWDFAEKFDRPVLAGDLQSFAAVRAAGVITRTAPLTDLTFLNLWFARARARIDEMLTNRRLPPTPDTAHKDLYLAPRRAILATRAYVQNTLRRGLGDARDYWPITIAYAGFYFSLQQALLLDALRHTLPREKQRRAVALCALIGAASRCSASPGHTAQPLGLKRPTLPHVIEAWNRSILDYVTDEVGKIAPKHARSEGEALVGSWQKCLELLSPRDVVFCDPPYSGVQYSRFYHVLETLSRGTFTSVSGTGRNPPKQARPESEFSRKSKSKDEVDKLLSDAADRELRLVITFPVSRQSNGLAAQTFARRAKRYFSNVDQQQVESIFSSLGGNGNNGTRPAHQQRVERIISCY